jgi:hypothetical protein
MPLLLGRGATFIVKPGVLKIQLGNVFVSTENSKKWCSIRITDDPLRPKASGGCTRIWPVE